MKEVEDIDPNKSFKFLKMCPKEVLIILEVQNRNMYYYSIVYHYYIISHYIIILFYIVLYYII